MEIVVDIGGAVQTFDIAARRAGRRVEVTTSRGGVIEVSEITRTGQTVRTARFMATRVVALVEHPALDGDGETTGRRSRRPVGPPQDPLLEVD